MYSISCICYNYGILADQMYKAVTNHLLLLVFMNPSFGRP